MLKSRDAVIAQIDSTHKWDVVVIGGGASGLGVALDAVSRGLSCILIEKQDFGSGTSSKSTKLVHGGVRYLAQGYISLVTEALRERSYFLHQAHHIADIQKFIIPVYGWFEAVKYYLGLKIYDILAINKSLGKTLWLSADNTISIFPTLNQVNLKGGIEYTDGKFDDSRMCIDLVNTIFEHKGSCINYFAFDAFIMDTNNKITGIHATDQLSQKKFSLLANVVVNATGVYASEVMDKADRNSPFTIAASQGSHIVSNKKVTSTHYGLMIPKTSDGRVLFAIPWKNKLLVGTTDIAQKNISDCPIASKEEVEFILANLQLYCGSGISHSDISTTFAGLRPLAAPLEGKLKTKEISRSHKVIKSSSGLLSIIGGKWTTFRKMGQDTIDMGIKAGFIAPAKSSSALIKIKSSLIFDNHSPIHPELPYSINDIKTIVEREMVESIDDLLSRRTRCTFISLEATKMVYKEIIDILALEKRWPYDKKLNDQLAFEKKYQLLKKDGISK
jgi:glycerol-3-phosphate dehydrogenase